MSPETDPWTHKKAFNRFEKYMETWIFREKTYWYAYETVVSLIRNVTFNIIMYKYKILLIEYQYYLVNNFSETRKHPADNSFLNKCSQIPASTILYIGIKIQCVILFAFRNFHFYYNYVFYWLVVKAVPKFYTVFTVCWQIYRIYSMYYLKFIDRHRHVCECL